MYKKLYILLIALLVISIGVIPAMAKKDKPKKADGIWYYTPDFSGLHPVTFDPYYGDPNKAFLAVPYSSQWTGTFNGESKDYGLAIAHGPEPFLFVATISFVGDVDGATGTLEIDTFGDRAAVGEDWKGPFVITGGTGDLAGLQGHGHWWGPGWLGDPAEPGVIYYVVDELQWPE